MSDEDKDDKLNTIDAKSTKAIDLLYEGMLFWHGKGQRIIEEIINRLNSDKSGKDALILAKIWKGYEDRWIDIAAKLAPYQSAKLQSIEVKNETIVKHIVRPYSRAKDHKEWLERVEEDRKYLPKPVSAPTALQTDDTIDEIEYEDINNPYNEREVH